MRAPSLLNTSRSSGVKKERPSARGLKSRRMRPFGCKTFCRTSLRKNFQSAGSHSCHSPGPVPTNRFLKTNTMPGHEIEFSS